MFFSILFGLTSSTKKYPTQTFGREIKTHRPPAPLPALPATNRNSL